MRDSGWSPVVLLALVLAVSIVAAGYLRGQATRTAFVAVGISAVVWIAGVALMLTGWNDIDGWVDCHGCSAWHEFGAFLFWTPLILVVLLGVAGAIGAVARRL